VRRDRFPETATMSVAGLLEGENLLAISQNTSILAVPLNEPPYLLQTSDGRPVRFLSRPQEEVVLSAGYA